MPSPQKHRHPWPLPGQKLQFHLTPLFNTQLLKTCLLNYSLSNPTRINSDQMHSKTTQRGKRVCAARTEEVNSPISLRQPDSALCKPPILTLNPS